jgi:CRP-like cAMP-binding protein
VQLHAGLALYSNSLLSQITRIVGCNRFHHIEARLARWLLMTQDRLGTNHLPMTQQFLAHMLGVRRPGVSEAASALQERGLIIYSRGAIEILDRKGLLEATCSCYRAMDGTRG